MLKFKLHCFQSIKDGLNTKSETPFQFPDIGITYSTNGYFLRGFEKNKLNEWKDCKITNAEWHKRRFYIYINNDNNHSYAPSCLCESFILYIHYQLKYKLATLLGILGGLYSIVDIIISMLK